MRTSRRTEALVNQATYACQGGMSSFSWCALLMTTQTVERAITWFYLDKLPTCDCNCIVIIYVLHTLWISANETLNFGSTDSLIGMANIK